MKKRVGKWFLAVVSLAALLLAVVGVLLWHAGRPPAFRLIGNHNPVYREKTRDQTIDVYCFEGNFSDLAAMARAELFSRGYLNDHRGMGSPDHDCIFVKEGRYRRAEVRIMAFKFEKATEDSIVWVADPGWVSVKVQRIRRPLWTFLPFRWQLWYQFHFTKGRPIRIWPP